MLYLLSPAKSLDYTTRTSTAIAALATEPTFMPRSAELIDLLRTHSVADVAALMDLSEPLIFSQTRSSRAL